MSRGIGPLQEDIRDAVRDLGAAEGGPVYAGYVGWVLAEKRGGIDERGLTPAFYKAFRRALGGLEGIVVRKEEKLTTVEQVVRWFPYCTKDAGVRDLRLWALPHLPAYLEQYRRRDTRYTPTENEDFLVGQHSRGLMDQARDRWSALEPRLRDAIRAERGPEGFDLLLSVFARGRELFGDGGLTHSLPFGDLVERAAPRMDKQLVAAVQELVDLALPAQSRARAGLKTELYIAADFGTNSRRPHVQDPFKEWLRAADKDRVENLPGHQKTTGGGTWSYTPRKFSPSLNTVLQREVLRNFTFLKLEATSGGSSPS